MSHVLARNLREHGHVVVTARDLELGAASDARRLLVAAERRLILVTHNGSHFEELHDAWLRWSEHWEVTRTHAGVVLLPSKPLAVIEPLLLSLLDRTELFENRLFRWRPAPGWVVSDPP